MSRTVRIDERAFNRGVDEVIHLKPIRRAMAALLSKGKVQMPSGKGKTVVVRKPQSTRANES